MHPSRFVHPFVLALFVVAGSGCFRASQPANFYQLQPLAPSVRETSARSSLLIGVGPVKLASYLDRPQIVIAKGSNQFELDEFQRWSEPLDENLIRVIVENLARMQPRNHVILYPWRQRQTPDVQIEIRIDRFHTVADGSSVLDVDWSLTRGGETLHRKRSHYRTSAAQPENFASIVNAQSETLAAFSRDLAKTIDAVAAQ
jgi:uncharacterized lipoprotein YmbA